MPNKQESDILVGPRENCVMRVDAWFAIAAAFSSVPSFLNTPCSN